MPIERIADVIQHLSVPRYSARLKAFDIPEPRWNEEPLMCLMVNDQWASHLIGVIIALDQQDTWLGTEDEVFDARQQINEIILALMERCNPMSGCCPEPLTRMTEDGTLEVSYDGGLTWTPATPSEDPRLGAPQLPPLTGDDGDEKRCQAANNVLGQFKDGIQTFEGYFDTTATVVEFVSAVAAAIATFIFAPLAVPIIVTAIIALMSAIWNAGKAAYSASFDDTIYGSLLCILYCNCQNDGTFTAEDFNTIRSRIGTDFSDIARDAFLALLNGVTISGLNNLATIPTGSSASCGSCECDACPDFDFTTSDGAWYQIPSDWGNPAGEYVEGQGWKETYLDHGSASNYINIRSQELTCVGTFDVTICLKTIAVYGDPIFGFHMAFTVNGSLVYGTDIDPIEAGHEQCFTVPSVNLADGNYIGVDGGSTACDWYVTSIEIAPHA